MTQKKKAKVLCKKCGVSEATPNSEHCFFCGWSDVIMNLKFRDE
jgi:ribosomal protein L37E